MNERLIFWAAPPDGDIYLKMFSYFSCSIIMNSVHFVNNEA